MLERVRPYLQLLFPGADIRIVENRLVAVEEILISLLHLRAQRLDLLDSADKFRRLGCHIVAVNRKSELLQPLVITGQMGIPAYVIFDADADKPDKNGSQAKHENDNRALPTLLGRP